MSEKRPSGPVLLWGSPLDLPIAAVCTALSRLGTPMFLVDQTRAGETSIDIEVDGALGGWVQVGDPRCALDQIRSDGYVFQIETTWHTWKNGFRVTEIPIRFTDRVAGKSKLSRRIVLEAIVVVWKLRFQRLFG